MAIQSVNPATGDIIETYDALNDASVQEKLEKSQRAYESWKNTSMEDRGAHMRNIAQKIRDNQEVYAQLLTSEMGKTITQARAEVEKCASNFDHYADASQEYLQSRVVETEASESYVSYEPLGVILNVMPWNFAFWQALRMAAPILMAGNTIVLKHASNVPGSALAMEALMLDAGLPEGVYQALLITSSQVESVIANDIVKGVSLTGSEYAGTQVGKQAGEAIKPVVLELGGSDPSIVLEDADLDAHLETIATSRLMNNGQSCIGSKRFIVHAAIYDEFVERMKNIFESYVQGDPTKDDTMIGPVVSESALEELQKQIKESVEKGAKIMTGGNRMGDTGFYLEPTILVDVSKVVPSYHEEIFGPVASIIKVDSDEEAIKVANDTRFGLGASLYTQDMEKAKRLIPQIQAGCVFVNQLVKSDPRLPFGGIKKSGVGRELSAEGSRAFTNTKTVWIQ